MAFWTVTNDEKYIADSEGNSYVIDSGMYDVIIKDCIVRRSEPSSGKKGVWLELIIDYNGTIQSIYRAIGLKNNDGSANFGESMLNKLAICCGAKSGFQIADPEVKRVCTNQKTKAFEDVEVLKDFENQPVTLRILKSYRKDQNGNITRGTDIRNIFRSSDHASAKEIIGNSQEKGKQYAKELETSTETNYRDGITPEMAEAYEQAKREGRSTAQPEAQKTQRRFGFGGSEDSQTTDDCPF